MALGYLLNPAFQYEDVNGKPLVGGFLRVYVHGTTNPIATYKDFTGDLNPTDIVLNNKGMAVVLVDAELLYDVYCYDRNGVEQWSRLNVGCTGGGSGSGSIVNITSGDGSISVDKSYYYALTTYDLRVNPDATELLEWFRSDSYTRIPSSNIYRPSCTKGTIAVGDVGVQLKGNQYYHVTGHIRATKDIERVPYYDQILVKYYLRGENWMYDQLVLSSAQIVDYSLGMSQEFEVSTDVMTPADCELYVSIEGQSINNGNFALADMEIHRIFSGAPSIPSGVLSRAQAAQQYQPLLTAGDNIFIDTTTWTISAAGGSGGGGSIYNSGDGTIVHNTGNHEIDVDWTKVQKKLTAGDGITIDANNVISSTGGSGTYTGGTGVVVNNTTHVISLDNDVVIDPNYVHTENNFTNVYKNKLDGIQAGAEQNVQSDWAQTNTSADDYIKNKPADLVIDPSYVHTDNNFTNIYKVKLDGIESGAEVNVQADWDEDDINSDAFIKNKPEVLANKDLVAGENITLVQTADNVVISAQYAGSVYDTQQISAGNHIVISSDAEISTDLSDSGELAAWYQVSFDTNWGTTAAFDNAGAAISPSNTFENPISTTSIVVDDTFGTDAQNELAGIINGSLLLRNGYVYHIEFNSNGIVEPPASLAATAYMRATIQKSVNSVMDNPTHVVSSSYEKTASCLNVHCDLVGDNRYGAIFLHNVKNQSGASLDATVRAYPTITVIARKK